MYRRSWEMQGNSLKKHKPSIKWVTFQASLSLICSDGGAFDRGTTLCSAQACSALQELTDWLGVTRGSHFNGLALHFLAQMCHIYKCPSWPLLLPWWAFVLLSRQKLTEGSERNRNTDVILSLENVSSILSRIEAEKDKVPGTFGHTIMIPNQTVPGGNYSSCKLSAEAVWYCSLQRLDEWIPCLSAHKHCSVYREEKSMYLRFTGHCG